MNTKREELKRLTWKVPLVRNKYWNSTLEIIQCSMETFHLVYFLYFM